MNDEPMTHEQELEGQLEQCRQERDEYLLGWQRAKADFVNYKREEQQRLDDMAKYGVAGLMRDLLLVLDSLELAAMALAKREAADKGLAMIKAQVGDILRRHGLERIPVSPGDAFDPAVAEAIAEAESDAPAGTIAEEVEAGYRLHDKVLRPARVKLSKGPQ